jgi:hypothetical protein
MIILLATILIFLLTGFSALYLSSSKRITLKIISIWLLVLIGLVALDLFAETIIFEWLQWNETTKNDWFFIIWWFAVFAWYFLGAKKIFQSSY